MKYKEIIEGCKRGDKELQARLVQVFAPTLMSICLRYANGDRSVAKDALQETFINVFKYMNSYKGKGSFEGWLKRIAVNCSISFHKKVRPIHFADQSELDGTNNAVIPDIYSRLAKEDILALIQELPQSFRLVFQLNVIEGYNHREIGEMLDITPSTSRATLSRARAKLIELLQQQANTTTRLLSQPLL
ncbi:MAG: sigma-70 family RNA polymerase sigma factor [Gammaproteobacteria bacterium]|nr:sigma-70 family RNA polymerase sigma factor [Gammaproteobacteria bacterium]